MLSPFYRRMIWHTHSSVIVMLTKQVEMGRNKCSHYWPAADDPLDFPFNMTENLRVSFLNQKSSGHIVTREFVIDNLDTGKSRKVVQVRYFPNSSEKAVFLLFFSAATHGMA